MVRTARQLRSGCREILGRNRWSRSRLCAVFSPKRLLEAPYPTLLCSRFVPRSHNGHTSTTFCASYTAKAQVYGSPFTFKGVRVHQFGVAGSAKESHETIQRRCHDDRSSTPLGPRHIKQRCRPWPLPRWIFRRTLFRMTPAAGRSCPFSGMHQRCLVSCNAQISGRGWKI